MNFFSRAKAFIKKNGFKAFIFRVLGRKSKTDILSFFSYITDTTEVPFNEEDYKLYKDEKITLNWIIPEMGAGSGGHINIFRFVSYLERHGVHNRVYLFNPPKLNTDEKARAFVKEHFEILDTNVEVFSDAKKAKFAHGTVATAWQTAYFVKNFNNTISKFYFVQDYEPYFYPLGSEYEFAKNTYKFGFKGITAGDWLKDVCNSFGMEAESFSFSYDNDIYKPLEKKDNRNRVFFYARPVTPRRDFELGLLALQELNKLVPDLEVVFAGWDVDTFNIPFTYRNEGIVKIENLAEIYSQCDMCLIISNTNLSLLPLEVMASNSVAVCSKGENSSWLVDEKNSILVDYEPFDIANTMAYYLNNKDELKKIREEGLKFAQSTSWDKEGAKVLAAVKKGIEYDAK